MNDPDELQRRLRDSLDEAASRTPPVDLARAALGRARRIRTRRRVTAAGVCLLAVSVVVPLGLRLDDARHNEPVANGDHTTPTGSPGSSAAPSTTPTQSTPTSGGSVGRTASVQIDGTPRGPAPQVGYIDGTRYHGSSGVVTLRHTSHPVKDIAEFTDGVGVWTENTSTDTKTFSTNGTASTLPTGTTVSNPAVDSVNHAVAWATHHVDATGAPTASDTLLYTDTLAATPDSLALGTLQVRHVMGAADGVVVFNAVDTSTGNDVVARADLPAGTGYTEPWPKIVLVTAVNPDLSLIAGLTTHDEASAQMCTTMFNAKATPLWRSCAWRPMEFSSDGERVLAAGPNVGLGPNRLAVMTPEGKVLRVFTTDGTFGRATFESDGSVVAVLDLGPKAAIVRCHVDGGCELATTPARITPGQPDSLLTPYQITAN